MGILNVTPDSFYDGNCYFQFQKALDHGLQLVSEGADLIDIGGCSTKPYSTPPTIEEEIQRVVPVIEALKKEITLPISIDTYNYSVAKAALKAGATFLNDVTGLKDPKMLEIAKEFQDGVCIMHMQNQPQTMQIKPSYPNGVIEEIIAFLMKQTEAALKAKIDPSKIYLDPGLGFGKSLADNFEILQNLDKFRKLGFPLLIGLSRKSFLSNTLNKSPQEALFATIAANAFIFSQVDIFRVHDVASHRDMVTILNKLAPVGKDK